MKGPGAPGGAPYGIMPGPGGTPPAYAGCMGRGPPIPAGQQAQQLRCQQLTPGLTTASLLPSTGWLYRVCGAWFGPLRNSKRSGGVTAAIVKAKKQRGLGHAATSAEQPVQQLSYKCNCQSSTRVAWSLGCPCLQVSKHSAEDAGSSWHSGDPRLVPTELHAHGRSHGRCTACASARAQHDELAQAWLRLHDPDLPAVCDTKGSAGALGKRSPRT